MCEGKISRKKIARQTREAKKTCLHSKDCFMVYFFSIHKIRHVFVYMSLLLFIRHIVGDVDITEADLHLSKFIHKVMSACVKTVKCLSLVCCCCCCCCYSKSFPQLFCYIIHKISFKFEEIYRAKKQRNK